MRKIAVLFICLLALLPLSADAGFSIDSYSVDIDVLPSRAAYISEELNVDFTQPSHGIIRDIQTVFPGVRAKVSDIQGSAIAGAERNGDFLSVLMGDGSRMVVGPVSYSLSYLYDIGSDRYRGYDEFYYNIVSPAWASGMSQVEFSVHFPYPIDADRVWLTYGPDGSFAQLPVNVSQDGMTVYGNYEGLPPYNAITLRVEMDDGYFTRSVDLFQFIPLIASILALVIIIILYIAFGRDEKIIAPVRFEPPENCNPVAAEYVYKSRVTQDSAAASIIYFADKGYISIDGLEDKNTRFHKLKELSTGSLALSTVFRLLFPGGPDSDTALLQLTHFADAFQSSMPSAVKNDMKYIYDRKSLGVSKMAIAVFFLAVIASSLLAGFESGEPMLSFFLFVPLLMLFIIHHAGAPIFVRIFFTIFLAVFVTIPFAGLLSQSFLYIVLPPFLSTLVAPVIIRNIRRYSAEGRKLRSEIDGYREFIDKVEADRIAKLSEEDPLFFYHVLPYAMVFGLADKWCDKFRLISIQSPDWYAGTFIYNDFRRQWMHDYSRMHAPRSSNAGRSSFRGSSGSAGGGFSGGGGRSW